MSVKLKICSSFSESGSKLTFTTSFLESSPHPTNKTTGIIAKITPFKTLIKTPLY
nr:MAG TPA: hypothetical protein [Caudoviricetes sp.]